MNAIVSRKRVLVVSVSALFQQHHARVEIATAQQKCARPCGRKLATFQTTRKCKNKRQSLRSFTQQRRGYFRKRSSRNDGDRLQNDEYFYIYYNLLVSAQGLFSLACSYSVTKGLYRLTSLIVQIMETLTHTGAMQNPADIKAVGRCSQTWDIQSRRSIGCTPTTHGDIIARMLSIGSKSDRVAQPSSVMLSVCHDYSIIASFPFSYSAVINDSNKYWRFVALQWQTQFEPIASRTDEDITVMRKRLITFPTMRQKLIDWVTSFIFPLRT